MIGDRMAGLDRDRDAGEIDMREILRPMTNPGRLTRFGMTVAPLWTQRRVLARVESRLRAEMAVRSYEAGSKGRRTAGWKTNSRDATAASAEQLQTMRNRARDMIRNNPYARRGRDAIVNNLVAWGIRTTIPDSAGQRLREAFEGWAETPSCDYYGRQNLWGLQASQCGTMVEAGEYLILRRWDTEAARRGEIALRLQVLEPDYLDTTRSLLTNDGGYILQGVQFDALGRVVGYWMFDTHPGASIPMGRRRLTSRFVPASEVIHGFREDRPGQIRGVTWYAPVMMRMRDYDDFEDARLMAAKVAACFAAFVKTGGVGSLSPLVGQPDESATGDKAGLTDRLEPALIQYLRNDEEIEFAEPPAFNGHREASSIYLHAIAAGLGVTYEALTGDLRGVNFSSGRMGRLEFQRNVDSWRWQTFIPQACDGVWRWFNEAAIMAGLARGPVAVEHQPPPLEPLDPEKEARGYRDLVRSGFWAHPDVVSGYGFDPAKHYAKIAETNRKWDELGIVLDADPRKVSATGLTQARPPGSENPDPGEPAGSDTDDEGA